MPLYEPYGEDTIKGILNQTELSFVCIEKKHLNKYINLANKGDSGSLKTVASFDPITEDEIAKAQEAGLTLVAFDDLKKAAETSATLTEPTKDTIMIFVYTSGTTGEPKAAMLTHYNVACLLYTNLTKTCHESVHLSYLPAAHIFEQAVFADCCRRGYKLGFYQGDPLKLIEDAQALQPTLFCAVPRVLNRVYDKVMDGVSKAPAIKQYLFNRALRVKTENYLYDGSLTHTLYDALVFKKIKALLGGRVE